MTVQFMDDWNFAAESDCANNPVDISRPETGSTDCHDLTSTRKAQKYTTHALASAGFAGQLQSGNFPHLHAALNTSNPYAYPKPAEVTAELKTWGSPKQASYYASNATGGSSTTDGGIAAPQTHKGYHDVRKSLNSHWGPALRDANHYMDAALRSLGRGRKVHH
jgi:hypothetical protein